MARTFDHEWTRMLSGMPAHYITLMWAELPSLVNEIIATVREEVPEYAGPMDGPHERVLHVAVERILTNFVEQVETSSASPNDRKDVCRRLGFFEAQGGRSMASLQAAYTIGLQLAWRRMIEVGERHHVDPSLITRMGEALIAYMNDIAVTSAHGYQEALAGVNRERDEQRTRLLRMITDGPLASPQAIARLADRVGWTVPDAVTPVAVRAGAACTRSLFDGDTLVDWDCAEPYILVPGPVDDHKATMLAAVLAQARTAVGPTVRLPATSCSLRWARQALTLAAAGVIADGPMIWCHDHLLTLLLHQDPELTDFLARQELAPLEDFAPAQRHRLLETLRIWLTTRDSAAEVARRLGGLHPQSVRYRIRQLQRTFGEALHDPDHRLAIELALRATGNEAPKA